MDGRIDAENRLDPWCFQNDPQWGPNEECPRPTPDHEGRLQNRNWCRCNNCQLMTSVFESICCYECGQINAFRQDLNCVILHPEIERSILTATNLEVNIIVHNEISERQLRRDQNRYYYIFFAYFIACVNCNNYFPLYNSISYPVHQF